jgi:H+/Cl- antiporter ClcA
MSEQTREIVFAIVLGIIAGSVGALVATYAHCDGLHSVVVTPEVKP